MASAQTGHADAAGLPGSLLLACLLAAAAGFVDGVGARFVSGVFVSFMSGNTTSTGIALGDGDWGKLGHVVVVIPMFVAGVVVGALILHWGAQRRVVVLALVMAVLAVFAVEELVAPASPSASGLPEVRTLAPLTVAMGMMNTTLRHVGSASVGLGYVTGTLVSLGEALADLAVRRTAVAARPVVLYAGVWAAFLGGAALGAAAVSWVAAWAVVAPIALLAVVVALPSARSVSDPLAFTRSVATRTRLEGDRHARTHQPH